MIDEFGEGNKVDDIVEDCSGNCSKFQVAASRELKVGGGDDGGDEWGDSGGC